MLPLPAATTQGPPLPLCVGVVEPLLLFVLEGPEPPPPPPLVPVEDMKALASVAVAGVPAPAAKSELRLVCCRPEVKDV